MGIEYPLVETAYGPKWGYGSPDEDSEQLKEPQEIGYMRRMLDAQIVIAIGAVATAVLTGVIVWKGGLLE